ncbi:B-cell scaffold protein with ankyrin repeats isoform X2 [Pyxicephalus adspersus]|uniref:B-cell scaffold protein with ankyrin repeats isoform X2 n=1 Tax=Pyxicephalus adspersus TaxID=30357 RepID=UPI003B5A4124
MTEATNKLLVIFEKNGEEWAMYLKDILKTNTNREGIFLCNLDCESEETLEHLIQSNYQCKLLILTSYLLEIFCRNQCTSYLHLLQPSHRLVLLLCGVESPEGFYEIFPLERDCHVILSDEDPKEYISVVSKVINKDCEDKTEMSPTSATEEPIWNNPEEEDIKCIEGSPIIILPKRISCENPGELFIILQDEMPNNSIVEFCTENQIIRRQPMQWNKKIQCLKAPDLPPGPVIVNVYSEENITATTTIEYYSAIQELKLLLSKVVDPITFICQAFDVYTLDDLDKVLAKSLQNKISSQKFSLHEINQQALDASSVEIPTILHGAAKLGLKEVALLLLQSPVADHICQITNKYGDDPATIAEKHGHKDIQEIILDVANKVKANHTDIAREVEELGQEDVYVDMVKGADADQHPMNSCGNGHEECDNTTNNTEQDGLGYAAVNSEEQNDEEHPQYPVSDGESDTIDKYHCSTEDESSSMYIGNDDDVPNVMQGEEYQEDIHEKWLCGNESKYSNEAEQGLQNAEYNLGSSIGNLYVPLPPQSDFKNLPVQIDCSSASMIPLPEDSPPEVFRCLQEEEASNESKVSQECPEDEEQDNEFHEEPLVFASTEDDVYIVFETNTKGILGGQQSFITHDTTVPKNSLCSIQEERNDSDNENVTSTEPDEYTEEGDNNEYNEEPLLVASMEDDVYIVFETGNTETQQRQNSSITHNPVAPVITSNPTIESVASYNFQEGYQDSFCENYIWDETVNDSNEEDPYSLTSHENEYVELPFEPADEVNQRSKKSFIGHRAPLPAPRPQAAATSQPEDSYISRVFRQKEEEKKIYSTGPYQSRAQMTKNDSQATQQPHLPSGQDELILLQEKVKMGIITMDEAIKKFQQWQTEKSGLDLLQQKKLQQLRNNIIGDKPDDDKLTIVHQPSPISAKQRATYGMFDNSIYQKARLPAQPPPLHHDPKKYGTYGKLPYNK